MGSEKFERRTPCGRIRRALRWSACGLAAIAAHAAAAQDARPQAAAERPLDARRAIREGNQLFQQQQFAEALDRYVSPTTPTDDVSAELLHNRAAALYKLGDYDAAREAWLRAASQRDAAFESGVRYNLGNVDYIQAMGAVEQQDLKQALELLERSRANYLDSLRLDATRSDARANLELAGRLIERLRQLAEEQQEQQQQQQQQQQEQQQQEGESESCDKDCGQCGGGGDCSSKTKSDESSQDCEHEHTDPSSSSGSDQPDEDFEPQPEEQGEPEEAPGDEQQEESGEDSDQRNGSGQEQDQSAGQEGNSDSARIVDMSSIEAERLLQMIRDAELKRRQTLRARMAQNQRPVDKDW